MAKLDSILLKTSIETQEDLIKTMKGENPAVGELAKIEVGEVIVRRDVSSGACELWTLNAQNEPTIVSVDIAGILPDFNPDVLEVAKLDDIGDVDYSDGYGSDGPGTGEAGYVLTWDGQKWVVRPQLALEFDGGVIPSLNYIGDVNYSYYADGWPTTADPGKFLPVENDFLIYKYNYNTQKYEWAPIPSRIEYLQDITTGKGLASVSDKAIIFSSANYNALLFGNGKRGLWDNNNGVKIGNTAHFLSNSDGIWTWTMEQGIVLEYRDINGSGGKPIQSGIYYRDGSAPETPPSPNHLITLKHAQDDWATHGIGELVDVNLDGLLQGQVLVWNSLTGYWEPGSGPAPDFSQGSIEDLQDIVIDNAKNRQTMIYDLSTRKWRNGWTRTLDIIWDYCNTFSEDNCPDCYCKLCNYEELGRIITNFNVPYICLITELPNGNQSVGYVRLLTDGKNDPTPQNNLGSPATGASRKDPLSAVAYEGQLGNLYNVSTADAFNRAALVYDSSIASFRLDYPALDLSTDSIGSLGDVCAENAGVGYGLIWNGDCWEASSLDQKIRLDDLQDVQFGDLGVTNDKLVAAFMLVDGDVRPELRSEQDLSPSLAVSTPKADAQLGTTGLVSGAPAGGRYTHQSRLFEISNTWTLAQKLDNYVRWPHDGSWQTIDGDGCIEVWFYPTKLLDNRTIFRKESRDLKSGGYLLRINEDGSLYFSVSGAEGQSGFAISSPINFVSMLNWHHVAVTKQGNVCRLYLDGDKIGEKISTADWTGDGFFSLGRNDLDDNNPLTHDFFKGYMYDLRVTRGRAKYDGETYSLPSSLEDELVDTTPQAGDFLSYNGTYWTNVAGVSADISNNSITELIDVDTTSRNPEQGDALVWTGELWEPGIPGIGATWSLDDMTDVTTNYTAAIPVIYWAQAEMMAFSRTFITQRDLSYLYTLRGAGTRMQFTDGSFTCNPYDPESDGPYSASHETYFGSYRFGQLDARGIQFTLLNSYGNCSFPSSSYAVPMLQYDAVPGSGTGDSGTGITTDTFVPCVENIRSIINWLLNSATFNSISDVNASGAVNGQALIYKDGYWVPSSEIAADISQNSLNDLADVESPNPSNGEVLTWDEAAEVWKPEFIIPDIDDFQEFGSAPLSNNQPVEIIAPGLNLTNEGGQSASGTKENKDKLFSLVETGYRGFIFQNHKQSSYGQASLCVLETIRKANETTSILLQLGDKSSLEINEYYFRVAHNIANSDKIGFRFGTGTKGVYETELDWGDYNDADLLPKSAIQWRIEDEAANLDLSIYSIDDLGDVDSTGKGQGWAITWDVESSTWKATDGVAANLQLSSIGELNDVVKVSNTNADTNDGSLSYDVGVVTTSRPQQELGGMVHPNQAEDARYGWSDDGMPKITADAGLGSALELQENRLHLTGNQGAVYATNPALTDFTLPSWLQVRQQIARQQTDFTALFFMSGNTLSEEAYNWPIDIQLTSAPNPAYFSNFGGQWSLNFSKSVQDKFLWSEANGAKVSWQRETVYSMEFWLWVDDQVVQDRQEMEFVISPIFSKSSGEQLYSSNGFHVGLTGDRTRIFATNGHCDVGNSQPTSTYVAGNVKPGAAWNHVYFANEGDGRMVLFINGLKAGEFSWSSVVNQWGGFSFGGRTTNLSGSLRSAGYLTGFVDDLRITRGWLPYTVEQTTVPVPVEPLTAAEFTYKLGTLDQFEDVRGTDDAIHGQVLTYNAIDEVWEPGEAPGYDISANSIGDFNDVNASNSTPDQDDVLRWNAADENWERSKVDGLGGVRPLNNRSATPGVKPQAGTIFAGELFLNMADRELWALDDAGQPFSFANGDLEDKINEIDRVVGGDF